MAGINLIKNLTLISSPKRPDTITLSYPPPRVRVRATVKLSAAFFHDESSITIGGYESAIAPETVPGKFKFDSNNNDYI